MSGKLSMANLIAGAGALVTLLFSFFGFYKFGDDSRSAWSSDGGAFATTVPAILALALLVVIGLELGGVKLPERVITFDWKQIKATWGIAAAGLMLSWIATDLGGLDKSAMFWLQVLGSIAMAVGTIMALLGKGTRWSRSPRAAAVARRPPLHRTFPHPRRVADTHLPHRRRAPAAMRLLRHHLFDPAPSHALVTITQRRGVIHSASDTEEYCARRVRTAVHRRRPRNEHQAQDI